MGLNPVNGPSQSLLLCHNWALLGLALFIPIEPTQSLNIILRYFHLLVLYIFISFKHDYSFLFPFFFPFPHMSQRRNGRSNIGPAFKQEAHYALWAHFSPSPITGQLGKSWPDSKSQNVGLVLRYGPPSSLWTWYNQWPMAQLTIWILQMKFKDQCYHVPCT